MVNKKLWSAGRLHLPTRVSMVNKKLWSAGRLHLPEVNIVRVGSTNR